MSMRPGNDPHGRDAAKPSHFPPRAWWSIIRRVVLNAATNRTMLVAAGVTFYLLLALFPGLAAFVSFYGFVADPVTIADHIAFLGTLLPQGGLEIIESQLDALIEARTNALTFGFVTGLAVALWSANNGVKALFDAMNLAYGEDEKRSFLALNALSGVFTLGALLVGIMLILTVGVVPAALALLNVDHFADTIIRWSRWPLMFAFASLAISLVYRFGPSREPAKWRWLSFGAMLATSVWMATSAAFSWYLQNFADYNATYGSLGAVIGFMIWIWISTTIIIVGAEINAEMEHQTALDTTTGTPEPLGDRGAVVADHVAGLEPAAARAAGFGKQTEAAAQQDGDAGARA